MVDAAHEDVLLTEQIGFGLLLEGGLDGAGAQGAQSLGIRQAQRPGLAVRILLDGDDDRHATAGGVLTTHDVARALRGDHEHRVILGGLDVAVVDVEAVGEGQGGAGLEVRLDLGSEHLGLELIRQKDHHHVGLGGGVGHGLDLEALLLGVLDGLGGGTQADDDVDAGITQVQRVGVTLRAVADDGDLLAVKHGQIGVLLVPDSCCHDWHTPSNIRLKTRISLFRFLAVIQLKDFVLETSTIIPETSPWQYSGPLLGKQRSIMQKPRLEAGP